ncbi:CheR family methyltransferase [Sporomusa aerivorans]|uniref:CheR family methyltransferase n=1 Tax=Sporomusa aerivorans TaxID=204936 RepID=UPI00352AC0BE
MTKLELEELDLFISRRFGLEFRHQRLDLLKDAVQRRIALSQALTVRQYLNFLQQREEEVLLLINLLTVHETYFFREPTQLEVMAGQVIPQLLKNAGAKPLLRLLSAGCSTGEEAYSMAIAALKIPGAGSEWDFEVIGMDVDKAAVDKAQAGIYGSYSFRSCPEDVRDNYFQPVTKDRFAIKPFVKAKVRFEHLNLFEPVYPEWLRSMNIVFYRNVSIYFSQEQRQEVFRRLAGLLTAGGCLFLSCTETLYHNNNLMSLVKSGDTFYYRKQDRFFRASPDTGPEITAVKPRSLNVQPSAIRHSPAKAAVKKRTLPSEPSKMQLRLPADKLMPGGGNKADICRQLFADALELVNGKNYDEAIVFLDRILARDSFYVRAHTLKANILLNRQNAAAAIEACQAALVIDALCLEAYLLLGMAARLTGMTDEAIHRFKEAVYVSPECWLAHFFLAEMYQMREENAFAKREYEVAMRLLTQGKFAGHGLSFFLVPFQLEDFIRLCQHNIAKLQD